MWYYLKYLSVPHDLYHECFCVMLFFDYLIRPTPIIYWIKEDGTLPINRTFYRNFKKTLQIVQVTEADSGNYQCIAKNALGAIHHTISVTVKGISLSKIHGSCLHENLSLNAFNYILQNNNVNLYQYSWYLESLLIAIYSAFKSG